MSGPWQSTPSDDIEDAPCQRCGTNVHLHNDPPCPHGYIACYGCGWETVCVDCRTQATADMFADGEWTAAGDPLFDQHATPTTPEPTDASGGYWWDGAWVQVPAQGKRHHP